jgi:hypothetical protein
VFADPVVPLVLVVCEGGGWRVFVEASCDCEAARASAYDQDVMDVHLEVVFRFLESSFAEVLDIGSDPSRQHYIYNLC